MAKDAIKATMDELNRAEDARIEKAKRARRCARCRTEPTMLYQCVCGNFCEACFGSTIGDGEVLYRATKDGSSDTSRAIVAAQKPGSRTISQVFCERCKDEQSAKETT